MTFDDAMILTRTVSSPAAFEDEECRAYFDILMTLPENALIVEVGLEYGRSSSIALQVAQERQLHYRGIDPFTNHYQIMKEWLHLASGFDGFWVGFTQLPSNEVFVTEPIHCILIDGDHSHDMVLDDLNHFAPLVTRDGYLLMHDYGRDSLPEVYRAARNYFGSWNPRWDELPTVGTLGIWRRV